MIYALIMTHIIHRFTCVTSYLITGLFSVGDKRLISTLIVSERRFVNIYKA